VDEFDEAFDLHLVTQDGEELKGLKKLVGSRVYFISASCYLEHERTLRQTFDCKVSRYKSAYEISNNTKSNI
jgi:hypothetical protein